MERFFDKKFNSHEELMKYLNKKLKPNEKLVSIYTIYDNLIVAIFERVDEKIPARDYVVVNYNQKPENTITPTKQPFQPFYCGGCTTMFND